MGSAVSKPVDEAYKTTRTPLPPTTTDAERIEMIRKVLGFDETVEQPDKDGTIVKVSGDTYYAIGGVIADAEAGKFDAVCTKSLKTVETALAKAKLIIGGFEPITSSEAAAANKS